MESQESSVPEGNALKGAINHVTLIFKLLGDSRVSLILKGIFLVFSLGYVLNPADLFPEAVAPFLGPLAPLTGMDDLLFVYVASKVFENLCPEDVVSDYKKEDW